MKKKMRAVAYCRVSTDEEAQESSFENQIAFFRDYVKNSSDLEFAILDTNEEGVYADKGVSGTKLSRPQFDKMLKDAGLRRVVSEKTGKQMDVYEIEQPSEFDIILVKDVSRLARNVGIDSIVKTLKENNVYIRFIENSATTENSSGDLAIRIFESIAEEESKLKSRSVSFGYREGAKKGNIYVGGHMYGYDYKKIDKTDPDNTNKLIVNEKEAAVVRLIFALYTEEGLGHQQICNELAKRGIRNTIGNKFTRSTIKRILCNKRYIGVNEVYKHKGKRVFKDKRDEEQEEQTKILAQKAIENLAKQGIIRIPQIISKEQFDKAQDIMESNRKKYNCNSTYHGTTPYARKIRCSICGNYFIARCSKRVENGTKKIRYYACTSDAKSDPAKGIFACGNKSVREDVLTGHLTSDEFYRIQIEHYEEMLEDCEKAKNILLQARKANYTKRLEAVTNEVNQLEAEFERLKKLYRKGDYTEAEYDKESEQIKETLNNKRELKELLSDPIKKINGYIDRVKDISDAIHEEMQMVINDRDGGKTNTRNVKKALQFVDTIWIDNSEKKKNAVITIVFKTETDMFNVYSFLNSITHEFIESLPKQKSKKTMKELVVELQDKGIDIHMGKNVNE